MIKIAAITKSFGTLSVLGDISFNVADGAFVTIFGPSGCGKTTLLRILAGLERPDRGTVTVNGVDAFAEPDHHIRTISVVWQDPRLLPWRTALQNISFGLELREFGYSRAELRSRAMDALRLVGLADFAQALPRELSGGMRQRVNLARALVLDTDIVLMDEPLANLNEVTEKVSLMKQILKIWEMKKKTILYVTHGLNEGIYLSDKIIVCSTKPTSVIEQVEVKVPRPRDLTCNEANELRALVTRLMDTQLV